MLENKSVRGIHVSRYVASWAKAGGTLTLSARTGRSAFRNWLSTLTIDGACLTENEIQQICNYASNGKFELETSAKMFLEKWNVTA